MALKRALVTQAMGTGTAPFTADVQESNAGFDTDIKVAIFTGAYNSSVNASSVTSNINYGCAVWNGSATDETHLGLNNLTGRALTNPPDTSVLTVSSTQHDDDVASYKQAYLGYGWNVTTWGTDSITVTHLNTVATARYATTMLLGGDIEANVVTGSFSASNSINISHGLSGAPEIILIFSNLPQSIPDTDPRDCVGFYAGGAQVCRTAYVTNGAASQTVGAQVLDAYIAADVDATGAVQLKYQLSSIGASTVTCKSYNDAGTLTNCSTDLVFVFIRGTADAITAKAGIYTTGTSTGNESIGASLAVQPQGLILIPTRMTAVNTADATDAAGQLGMFMAVDRSTSATTQQGGAVMTINVGQAYPNSTYVRTHVRNDCVLRLTQATGGDEAVATVNAWQADDVQLSYSDAPGSAYKIPYLMFGSAAASATLTPNVGSVSAV